MLSAKILHCVGLPCSRHLFLRLEDLSKGEVLTITASPSFFNSCSSEEAVMVMEQNTYPSLTSGFEIWH